MAMGVVQLRPGDLLIGYTDGVIEATGADGEEFGVERLCRAAQENVEKDAAELVQEIFDAVDRFSRGPQNDDATVLAMRMS
jgi:sigma-B regulation protein RsbU (phosphoserine phosphatase)